MVSGRVKPPPSSFSRERDYAGSTTAEREYGVGRLASLWRRGNRVRPCKQCSDYSPGAKGLRELDESVGSQADLP